MSELGNTSAKSSELEKVWIYRRPLSQKVEPSFLLTKRLATRGPGAQRYPQAVGV